MKNSQKTLFLSLALLGLSSTNQVVAMIGGTAAEAAIEKHPAQRAAQLASERNFRVRAYINAYREKNLCASQQDAYQNLFKHSCAHSTTVNHTRPDFQNIESLINMIIRYTNEVPLDQYIRHSDDRVLLCL